MNTLLDSAIAATDTALRTLFAPARTMRTCPTVAECETTLTVLEKTHAGALMRVNHVGEVCAQALYTGQAFATRNEATRAHLLAAAAEETDHLAWCKARLDALGDRPSLLNPLWYAGAFGLGVVAGKLGDAVSFGFVAETERQVEAHLHSHLELLPEGDHASRAIVAQMKDEEAEHGAQARAAGGMELPGPVKALMAAAAKVMTTVAYRV